MVSIGANDCLAIVEGGREWDTQLPPRLFATDRYPCNRLNIYSKPEILAFVRHTLHGTPELEKILSSPLRGLFELPVRQCPVSCKLIHSLLTRQLVTGSKYTLWTVFGKEPLRFGLEEFRLITGLSCSSFPPTWEHNPARLVDGFVGDSWEKFIGINKEATLDDIRQQLESDSTIPGWKKLGLALIMVVDGVLIADKQRPRPTPKYVAMLEDVDTFLQFPWGRESFNKTMCCLREPFFGKYKSADPVQKLVRQLQQDSFRLKGFPLALQIFAFRSIPALQSKIPSRKDSRTILDLEVPFLPNHSSINLVDTLSVESQADLDVLPLATPGGGCDAVCSDKLEVVNDERVIYMEQLIRKGHRFEKGSWPGGIKSEPLVLGNEVLGIYNPTPKTGASIVKMKSASSRLRRPLKEMVTQKTSELRKDELVELLETLAGRVSRLEGVTKYLRKRVKRRAYPFSRKTRCLGTGRSGRKRPSIVDGELPGCEEGGIGLCETMERNKVKALDIFDRSGLTTDSCLPPEKSIGSSVVCDGPSTDVLSRCVPEAIKEGLREGVMLDTSTTRVGVSMDFPCLDGDGGVHADGVTDHTTGVHMDIPTKRPCVNVSSPWANDFGCVGVGCRANYGVESDPTSPEKPRRTFIYWAIDHPDSPEINHILMDGVEISEPILSPSPLGNKQLRRRALFPSVVSNRRCRLPERQEVVHHGEDEPFKCQSVKVVELSDSSPAKPRSPSRLSAVECIVAKMLACSNSIPGSGLISPLPDREWDLLKSSLEGRRKALHITPSRLDISNKFLLDLAEPRKWLTTFHMEVLMIMLAARHNHILVKENQAFTTPYLTSCIQQKWSTFKECTRKTRFAWDRLLNEIVTNPGQRWMEDVLTVYCPKIWNNNHWVGLAINLNIGLVEVLDPLPSLNGDLKVDELMEPILKSLPYRVQTVNKNETANQSGLKPFTWIRLGGIYRNERAGDCGPVSIKFMEMHAFGDPTPHMSGINDSMVDDFRKQYTMEIYKTIVLPAYEFVTGCIPDKSLIGV